jgi:hypothetical protein
MRDGMNAKRRRMSLRGSALLAVVTLAVCAPGAVAHAPQAGRASSASASRSVAGAAARSEDDERNAPLDQAQLERLAQEIRTSIEELRGARFERPVRVELAGVERLRAYMNARIELGSTAAERAGDELVRKLLGLIPPQLDAERVQLAFLEQQVGGYYDPAEDAFYLMQGFGGGVARVILAHELVHALDDQLHDIDATKLRLPRESDVQLAYHAVVEGSATGVMNRWMVRNRGSLHADDLVALNELSSASLEGVPEALWLPTIAAYLCGASFLARSEHVAAGQMRKAEAADIERAFRAPPRSSEQLLHPHKYWDETRRDEPRALELQASALPEGWSLAHEDVIGELEWALVLRTPEQRGGFEPTKLLALLKDVQTNPAANGWGGARAALFARGESLALCVRTVWDSESDAAEFDEALRARLPELAAAAQALASQRELSRMLSGVELGAGASADERELWCWVGVEAKQLAALRAGVSWSIAPKYAATAPMSGDEREL